MVTRDDQLKWLAENSDSFTGEYVVMSMHHIGRAIEQGDNFPPKPPFGVYFFTRQEWMNEKDVMQKIATADNSWHERGELPPVGCECEVFVGDENKWMRFEVIAIRDGHALGWLREISCGFQSNKKCEFRPLRTERDKAIDSLIDIICAGGYLTARDGAAKAIAERIYDAGYRKQE